MLSATQISLALFGVAGFCLVLLVLLVLYLMRSEVTSEIGIPVYARRKAGREK